MSAHPHTGQVYEMPKHILGENVTYTIGIALPTSGIIVGMEITQATGLLRYVIQDAAGNRHWVYADEITERVRYLGIHNEGHDNEE